MEAPQLIVGGYSEPREPTPETQAILDAHREEIEAQINGGEPFPEWNMLNYRSQVVAGTNYNFTVQVDQESVVNALISQALPCYGGETQLTSAGVQPFVQEEAQEQQETQPAQPQLQPQLQPGASVIYPQPYWPQGSHLAWPYGPRRVLPLAPRRVLPLSQRRILVPRTIAPLAPRRVIARPGYIGHSTLPLSRTYLW